MISIRLPFKTRTERDEEAGKIARLEEAETEVRDLRERAEAAITKLDDRQRRNHWRESIQRMIQQGA